MQFDFSEDQKEMQDSIRRFFEKHSPTASARAVIDDGNSLDEVLWRELGAQGFLAAAIPEQFGGVGAGYLELCIVAQEAGRALAPVPTVSSIYQVAEFILRFGDDDQKARWLPLLASGEAIGAIAVTETAGAPFGMAMRVEGSKLTGEKIPVADVVAAHLAIVLARGEGGQISAYLVDLTQPGVRRSAVDCVDPSRQHGRLVLDGAEGELIGGLGQGLACYEAVRNRAAVLAAFEQIGGAEAALMMARDYALQRFAFGRQIGSFQAIKHMLADMFVSFELARSNCYFGAWALSAGDDKLGQAAAAARVSATRAYQLCAANNIQIHGGMGFTWEFDCHLHYRRSNYLALTLGGLSLWEQRLIERMIAA